MDLLYFALFFLGTAPLIAWLYILLQPARPWDLQPVGDDGPVPDTQLPHPPVSVIVPARNEAESLPLTLPALLQQDYPGPFRVYLVDDRSTDGTAEIARGIAAKLNCPERLTVLTGAPLPEGWVGKVWALTQGAKAAQADGAEFVLLTDADIQHAPSSLRRLAAESRGANLGLNSRMARLRCVSAAEKLLIPPFVYFFNLLYPMRRLNDPQDPLAGAAGGCAMLSAEALRRMGGGFESIKSEIIDDVNLGRQVKGHGLPIRLSLSRTEVLSLREYPAVDDIWKMVRRTAFTELKYSWLRLAGAMAGLGLIFVVPFLGILGGILMLTGSAGLGLTLAPLIIGKSVLALALMAYSFVPAVRFFELPLGYAFTLPISGVMYGAMTVDSALRHASGKGLVWREPAKK